MEPRGCCLKKSDGRGGKHSRLDDLGTATWVQQIDRRNIEREREKARASEERVSKEARIIKLMERKKEREREKERKQEIMQQGELRF